VAHNWTPTARKLAALRRVDAFCRPLFAAARALARRPVPGPPRRILLVEPWNIGDVVIVTAALVALRRSFPDAHVTLLARPFAATLLAHTGLVDAIETADIPWTAPARKYALERWARAGLPSLLRRLRAARFDLVLDARMDARSNALTYLSGAARRVGFDAGGATALLTDLLPARVEGTHKVDDWLALARYVGADTRGVRPTLRVTEEERARARATLADAGVRPGDLVVALHVGASHHTKRWDERHFATVADGAAERSGARVVVFVDPDGAGAGLPTRHPVTELRLGLRDFMAAVAECRLLVSNDTGPMHIAAALGVPVVAVFGPTRSDWFGPYGDGHRVVQVDNVACRPCSYACPFPEPHCIRDVRVDAVLEAMEARLSTIAAGA
jgi:ADP-heptose:LPS heptosyltransferase